MKAGFRTLVGIALGSAVLFGQARWTAPRTPDGQPDLQGVWTNATLTPFERSAEFANKPYFTREEATAFERRRNQQLDADRRDSNSAVDIVRAYNDFWWDWGDRVGKTLRTSIVVEPADGRLPPLTSEAQRRLAAVRAEIRARCETTVCSPNNANQLIPNDGPEDRELTDRCIVWGQSGPPMLPSAYNNNYKIVQGPGYVAILVEMIHDVRIIPLDGRPHLPGAVFQNWVGDSRGHWEGETLVVETTNIRRERAIRGATENVRVIERFTRVEPEMILYEFTVEDPQTWTRPWSGELPMMKSAAEVYEYACHEGNYGLSGILAGAREAEAARK